MKVGSLFRIDIDKKKGLIGLGLGLVALAVLYLLRDVYIASESDGLPGGYLIGIPLAVMFTIVGFLRISSDSPVVTAVLNTCWYLVSAIAAIFGVMAAVECLGIWRMTTHIILLNIVLFSSFVGFVYIFTGRLKRSVTIVSLFELVVACINSFVWQFRGREILFSDLSAAGTALTVASEYTPAFTLKMAIGLFMWMLVLFSQFSIPADVPRKSLKSRLAALAIFVAALSFTIWDTQDIAIQTYSGRGSSWNGFYVNFIISIRDAIIRPPVDYSSDAVEELAGAYHAAAPDASADRPNIIIIMNESFTDFSVFGENFNTNQPVTPYFNSLQENTIRGFALSSAYGGHTANSEFECLTGLSMGFLPVGSIPYQQYISENTFSLTWLLEQHGYTCFSTHPYHESGWGRKVTYPRLGFKDSTFLPDYPQQNLVREYVSDQEMYEYVIDKLNEDTGDQPQFIFGITMQNHGGYRYTGDNYTQHIELEGYTAEYPWAEQYLSLIHESDKALEYLITYLQDYEEDTVLLFFGDHFPSVEATLYNEIMGSTPDTLDKRMLQYKVPFMVWANYDIEEQTVDCTSLNYLSRYLLEAAGLELPEYHQFLRDVEKQIPAMNQSGYYSVSNGCFVTYDQAQGTEKEWLDRYAMVQYNALFDIKDRSSTFFEQYLPAEE